MEKKKRRRWIAGFLAVIMTITGVGIPLPFPSEASDIWPQKSTAPFYCLDGGKGWKKSTGMTCINLIRCRLPLRRRRRNGYSGRIRITGQR